MFQQTAWWPYEITGPKGEPAELVDFVLGRFGVDLCADDLGEPFEVSDEAAAERGRRFLNL